MSLTLTLTMCDVFSRSFSLDLLRGKSLLFMGDSIMRNIYKDLVYLLSREFNPRSELVPKKYMCAKGEDSFAGDRLIDRSNMTAGRRYREVRDWYLEKEDLQLSFKFITRREAQEHLPQVSVIEAACFLQVLRQRPQEGHEGTDHTWAPTKLQPRGQIFG